MKKAEEVFWDVIASPISWIAFGMVILVAAQNIFKF